MFPYIASSLELCSVLQPSMKSLTVGEFSVKFPFLSSLGLEQYEHQENKSQRRGGGGRKLSILVIEETLRFFEQSLKVGLFQ